jgi:6-phosphogluconolactonase
VIPPRVTIVGARRIPAVGASMVEASLIDAIERCGQVNFAVAGGRTPERVYRRLADLPVPWERVSLFFGDERAVPPDDMRSNFRMVRAALLDHLPTSLRAVYRMEAERDDLECAADEYADLLPDRLDLLLLGIGEDGHTASLFPGSDVLREQRRRVMPAEAPTPPRRLTITPPVIAAARKTLVIAAGARKAAAVQRAWMDDGSVQECPARLARAGDWLLDRDAARHLSRVKA